MTNLFNEGVDMSTLGVDEISSLINNLSTKIDNKTKKENDKEGFIEVWTKQLMFEMTDKGSTDIILELNKKVKKSWTEVKTDEKKCINDCKNCKYLNHKNKTAQTCKKYGNKSMRKAILLNGFDCDYTLMAHIANGLEDLNKLVLSGKLLDDIELDTNDKLEGIPTLNMPNIFTQITFKKLVAKNPQLLELPVVALLNAYFGKYTMCKNCQYCDGLCYNNKFLVKSNIKAINELKNLVAYILKKEELEEKINNSIGNSRLFRIHGNGEFHSVENLEFWIKIAKNNKKVIFYTYTKAYDLIENYLASGKKLPSNLIINVSMVEGQQTDLNKKYPLLMKNNKFIIILDKELSNDKKATICGGKCLKCDKGCHAKLRTENKNIYVVVH